MAAHLLLGAAPTLALWIALRRGVGARLRGPLLLDVVALSSTHPREDGKLLLRAVDGYAVALPVAQARAQRFIVATHLDGKPMALGGLGPLWAVYDADRFADMAARPVAERFGACPWALYHIEVAG